MDMQTKAAQATRNRRGVMMLPLLAAVAVAAITIIPVVRWCMAFINGTENINAQLEMQSIIQEYYSKVSAASYEELQATIASKGTTWTENVGGKYTLTIETSEAGKFENALCNLDEAAGAYDQACMKANITLVSKADPSRTVGMQVTRVATLNQLAELADKIEAEGERFADYYTKAEADAQYACPWDYHLVSGKCVACPAPSNWKQYRSGNCTLATCSTGYKANSAKTGCTKITCPEGQVLNGDNCEVLTCPAGYQVNANRTGCELMPCSEGYERNVTTGNCEQIAYYKNILMCIYNKTYVISEPIFQQVGGSGHHRVKGGMQKGNIYCAVQRWVERNGFKVQSGIGILMLPASTSSPFSTLCSSPGNKFSDYVKKGSIYSNYIIDEATANSEWYIDTGKGHIRFICNSTSPARTENDSGCGTHCSSAFPPGGGNTVHPQCGNLAVRNFFQW